MSLRTEQGACRAWAPFAAALLVNMVVGQDQVRSWGVGDAVDSEAFRVPIQKVSVASGTQLCMALTSSGRLVAFGSSWRGEAEPPAPPPGLTFVDVNAAAVPSGVLSDGRIVQWSPFTGGSNPSSGPPALAQGMSWLEIDSALWRSFALRSDGTIQSWGMVGGGLELVPTLPPGLIYRSVSAAQTWATALVSDGSVRVWGALPTPSLQSVPSLPAGVTYVKVHAGQAHAVALRSDGGIEAWGDNFYGQCSVPPLPQGTSYVDVSAGNDHTVALRIDGQWLSWGSNAQGQCNIPMAPQGTYVEMLAGSAFTVALRSDGFLESWGCYETPVQLGTGERYRDVDAIPDMFGAYVLSSDGSLSKLLSAAVRAPAPSLTAGQHYESVRCGFDFTLALVSDGTLRAWDGLNLHGQLGIPALPASLRYVAADAGSQNAVALRSDGSAVAWGDNSWGQTNIPPLPSGLTYTGAAAGDHNVLLLRSDGSIVVAGTGGSGIMNLPPTSPGLFYTEVACGRDIAAAIRSDGSIVSWGSGVGAVPPLPPGTSYVEVDCGRAHALARRSDGVAVTWGSSINVYPVPELDQGRSCLRIGAAGRNSAVLIGSESSYIGIGNGCGGSMPPARLVPRDTPQIGRTMPVLVTNLPTGTAIIVFGWQAAQPAIALAAVGPGCFARVSVDAVVVISGSGTHAVSELPVPFTLSLLGVRFYNQAIVPDPSAGNPLGAVVSEAAVGIVGG